ncbi:MAG TPA: uroporphyrinogen-III synthase [Pyrinomonadaceae bacterium]|jgi:uroporphyrinogen-III synthase
METSSNEKTYALFSNPANRKIVAALAKNNAKIFEFAPVEFGKTDDEKNTEIIKNNLTEFDWIIFPDVVAVDYFLQILDENQIDLFELDRMRVLAFGEAVADRLRFVQLHADIIPTTIESETIFSNLLDYLGDEDLSRMRFLLPKEIKFETELKHKLINSGASVTEIAVYKAAISEKNNFARLKALLAGGAIDEFIIASPEDLISLKHYLPDGNLSKQLKEIKISAVDEISMQNLRENNLRPLFFQIK